MADAGVPLHVLQEILGHASMKTVPTTGALPPRQSKPTYSSPLRTEASGRTRRPDRASPLTPHTVPAY